MRRFDKDKQIEKVNLLIEQRYLKSKGLINESERKTAQELGVANKILYHGTTSKIDKLDPLHRQNSDLGFKRSGSSLSGRGIYFSLQLGFDPNNPTYSESGGIQITATGENALKWTHSNKEYDLGYIYEMKFKPDAIIVDERYRSSNSGDRRSINIMNITKDIYTELRTDDVDAVWSTGEMVLLNEDAVQYFKLIYKSKIKYRITPWKMGKPQKELSKLFNKEDVESYLKQELGGTYEKIVVSGKDLYHNDDNPTALWVDKTVGNLEKIK